MNNTRKIQCWIYVKFENITNKKYYICDECHMIHKSDGNKVTINSDLSIHVHNNCANKLQKKVHKLLNKRIFEKYN